MDSNSKRTKSIFLEDGTELQFFKKGPEMFIDKTTLIYGRRQSGKSKIIEDIMFMCKDLVSMTFVISQSSGANPDYVGIVPDRCIKRDVTKEWLDKFLEQQRKRAIVYKTANRITVLKKLFDRIKTPPLENMENIIIRTGDEAIRKIEHSKLGFDEQKEKITRLMEDQIMRLKTLYKGAIRLKRTHLKELGLKSKDELCCLTYLDFIPHVLLVFDDCASAFKKWSREGTALKDIFYNGRHFLISLIITAQDDKEIDSELRKNAMVNIFTASQAANTSFGRGSNAYSKHEKLRAEKCIRKIWNGNDDFARTKNYKKLVYLQDSDGDPFRYMIADLHDHFRMCCPSAWLLNDKLEETKKELDEEQDFFDLYSKH